MLAIYALFVAALTLGFIGLLKPPFPMIWTKFCILMLCWGILCGSMAVSWANNLINFLEDRPIRHHTTPEKLRRE